MQATALIRILPPHRPSDPDLLDSGRPAGIDRSLLRSLAVAVSSVRRAQGFQRWQTFRALDPSNALIVLVDFQTLEQAESALQAGSVGSLLEAARVLGWQPQAPAILFDSFERRLGSDVSGGTLLRLGSTYRLSHSLTEHDRHCALHALAAPGTTRVSSAASFCGRSTAFRIDFDSEDGIWHFLDSPLRRRWSPRSEMASEETWALNLPRLEWDARPVEPEAIAVPPPSTLLGFSVVVEESVPGETLRLVLQGRADGDGIQHCRTLCGAAVAGGHSRLEVDVSGLADLTPEMLQVLLGAARALKQRGGQFVLIDNAERVKRVTRTRQLESSLSRPR